MYFLCLDPEYPEQKRWAGSIYDNMAAPMQNLSWREEWNVLTDRAASGTLDTHSSYRDPPDQPIRRPNTCKIISVL